MERNKRNETGITLIALVVTIVVLLILAGVSISMLSGENGIIRQAQEAKLETRGGSVEEEVNLWRSENKIRKADGQEVISKESLLDKLKNNGLVYEEEIDRENEIIRIGSREIMYGAEVIINIKKTPETEKATSVLLEVTSVEGIEEQTIQFASDEEYAEYAFSRLGEMEENQKEEIYVMMFNASAEANNMSLKFNNFNEVINYYYNQGMISENTKEAFYEAIGGKENFDIELIIGSIELSYDLLGKYNRDTKELKLKYQIINPNGQISNNSTVTENGEYTFTVRDFATNKKYTQTVVVNNIEEDITALKFLVNSGDDGIVVLPIDLNACEVAGGYQVAWGDGETGKDETVIGQGNKLASTKPIYISATLPGIPHTYSEKNKEYVVTITGTCDYISSFYSHVTREKILEIAQWGETGLQGISLRDCTNLRKIASPSENSFVNIIEFIFSFSGCTSLTKIPEDLFENCPNVTNFWGTFAGCTGLTGQAPELWTRGTNTEENGYAGEPDGKGCFFECTGLTNYDIIPDYWKKSSPLN